MKRENDLFKIRKKVNELFDEKIIDNWNIHKGKKYLNNLDFKKMKNIIYSWIKREEKLNFNILLKKKFYPDLIGSLMGAKIINHSEIFDNLEKITITCIGLPYYKLKGNPDYQKFILAIINYRIFINKISGGVVEYEKFIRKSKAEKRILASFISPTTEYFFRDSLDNEIKKISNLFPEKLNILVIGCATGSEVYSLAYILDKLNIKSKIKALDINKPAIEFAKRGVYSPIILKKIPSTIKKELFDRERKIKSKYKKHIKFEFSDIRNYKSKEKFDLILSRNILKYFNEDTKRKLLKKIFNDLLKPKGIAVFGIQLGSNSDINPSKYINCSKIGNYSFIK